MIITFVVLVAAAVMLVWEPIPSAVIALSIPVVLAMTGVLTVNEALSGFSNPVVVLFSSTFVIGAALFRTGLAHDIASFLKRLGGQRNLVLLGLLMFTAAALSAALSNTGTVAVLLPMVTALTAASRLERRPALMALAFSASLGGTLTLIGTPPNLIVQAALIERGLEPFAFFDFARIGLPIVAVSFIFLLTIGRKLLPKEHIPESWMETKREPMLRNVPVYKKVIAGSVMLVVLTMMAGGWFPLSIIALAGAITVVITGCISPRRALASLEWETVFLFAGMLSLSVALEHTGAGELIATSAIRLLGTSPHPTLVVAVLFGLTWLLTQFMSNTASAALLVPIGLSIAEGIGASEHAVLMAIAMAASCALATPIGTPPNLLVYRCGGFKFADYARVGLPLSLLLWALCSFALPWLWPLAG